MDAPLPRSNNAGDRARASWDDLNLPARLGTFLAAGLPVLQQRNPACIVAMQRLVEIVYCQDANRRGSAEHTSFTFLGYTFAHAERAIKTGWCSPRFCPRSAKTP